MDSGPFLSGLLVVIGFRRTQLPQRNIHSQRVRLSMVLTNNRRIIAVFTDRYPGTLVF